MRIILAAFSVATARHVFCEVGQVYYTFEQYFSIKHCCIVHFVDLPQKDTQLLISENLQNDYFYSVFSFF